ncbi:MAG: DNA polymerase (Family 10) [Promethearchaeota archaeon]|nr:MAG: DNA polymerase (Family 10) [Candidatus Lokiarchaeota archaeon]
MSFIMNNKVANKLFEIADLLELKGSQFKPRAYRRAAQNIVNSSTDIIESYENDKLQEIEGVGESIASKVREIIETGSLEYLEDLRKQFPEGLQEMMDIQGLGPKSLMKLYKELNIKNIEELEKAAKNKKIREIEGFGEKSEKNILKNINMYKKFQERFLLGNILPIAKKIESKLSELEEVERINLAGSIRRMKETIGDVDILIISTNPDKVMDYFTGLEEVERVVSKGHTRSTIITANKLSIDLRVVEAKSYGSALQYFTGSKEHNIKLRSIALDKNWKLSEYGLIDKDSMDTIASEQEKDIYSSLELDYIEPELREDRGEIEAAREGKLPQLIKIEDIQGDLHIHTKWSEGSNSIEEMAQAAKKKGYKYLAICDHAETLQVASGLTSEEIRTQMKEINQVNKNIEGITILSGIEANIDSEGNIDVKKKILKDLDVVLASVHSGFKSSEKKMTDRIINAMHNDYIHILGHPTGRMLNKREPYSVNLKKVFEAAEDLGIILEINAFPERLDLNDVNCKNAKNYDLLMCINTDSHHVEHLRFMEYGIATARRGWLEPKNVANTLDLKELRKLL